MKMYNLQKVTTRVFTLMALLTTGMALAQPMAGNYTINSTLATGGTNFHSFSDLASSLQSNGISGSVTATVAAGSGPYHEQVTFSAVSGTSASAGIILDGNGEVLSAITDSSNRHALRLDGCSYFSVNNLHVLRDSASTHAFYGIHLLGTGNHITISNCNVDMSGTTSTLIGAYIASGSPTSILSTGDFHSITITGCTAEGGGYGASVFGLLSNLASDIVINNNTFYDFHSNGVYLRETQGAIVSNNLFDKRTANITSANAIQIAQAANMNTQIFGNTIHISQVNNGTFTLRGIYLFNGTGHRIYNNVINDIRLTSGNFTAIEVRTSATAPEIAFNTISLDNASQTNGDLFGIKEELSNTNSVLRNNLISIAQTTTGNKSALVLGATSFLSTAFNSDYNLFWVPSGSVAMKNSASNPVFYATLPSWRSASLDDANSVDMNPFFLSAILPQPTNLAADNLGIAFGGITTDIAGTTRSATPDIGAYEFTATSLQQLLNKNSLTSYPNPATYKLYIQLPNTERVQSIMATDVLGKTMKVKFMQHPNGIVIFTGTMTTGCYMLQIMTGNRLYTSQFVKVSF